VARAGAAAAIESPGSAKRILLADDNEDFASSMATMLEAFGHEVRVANDGPRALAQATDFKPDFAFLDIGLPGLNGYDLARELRALPLMPRPILVAITGWGQESYKQRARDAGFDHHLVKPVEFQQIREILGGTAHG